MKQVGRELGVRYVLEGSVRKARQRGAHHRAADRRDDWHASLGRPLRRLARGCLRPSGQGRCQRRRGHRAGIAGGRDAPLGQSGRRPTSPPTISTCVHLRALSDDEERIVEALGLLEQAIAIDRALRAGTGLGGDLSPRLSRLGQTERRGMIAGRHCTARSRPSARRLPHALERRLMRRHALRSAIGARAQPELSQRGWYLASVLS